MNRRTRTLAGLLTLSALSFSFAETVYASMCTAMAAMGDMAGEMADAGENRAPSDGSDCLLMSGHEGRHDPSERDMPCPLSPAVGAGCLAVPSLPAGQIAVVPWTAGASRALAVDDTGPDLLLTHGLFRPPRA